MTSTGSLARWGNTARRPRDRCPRAWIWLVGACSGLAHAAEPAAATPVVEVALAQSSADKALAAARREADLAYTQALEALHDKRWLEAELLLERALMFYPAHAEAMLQLALLLAERDQPESARALIQALLDDPETPSAQREKLQALLRNPQDDLAAAQAAARAAVPRTLVSTSVGYSTNPLVASSARELVLTLPQGNVIVPLLRQARRGALTQAQLYHRWDNGLELQATAQSSDVDAATSAGRIAMVGPLPGVAAGDRLLAPLRWGLSAQRTLDGARRQVASLLWQRPLHEVAEGSLPLLYSLNAFDEPVGGRQGWSARVQQSLPNLLELGHLGWAEYEHATRGGPSALRAGWQAQWQWAPEWLLQGYLYAQIDTSGYSTLLKNNEHRRFLTANLSVERQIVPELWGGQLSAQIYWTQRWSNLSLFNWSDKGIALHWRRQWR